MSRDYTDIEERVHGDRLTVAARYIHVYTIGPCLRLMCDYRGRKRSLGLPLTLLKHHFTKCVIYSL